MIVTSLTTYNRLELTKRTLASYLETVTVPFLLVAVDNGSEDGTREWLLDQPEISLVLLSDLNRYPGWATNRAWELGLTIHDAEVLHHSDNDVEYLPGWCDEALERFDADPSLGQLGLRTLEEEGDFPNVGANSVTRRSVWDAGVRWPEEPWGSEWSNGLYTTQDGPYTAAVRHAGFAVTRVLKPCLVHLGVYDPRDAYYDRPGHPVPL